MIKYCAKRLVVAAATVLLIATITFLLMNAVPGSPFLSERGQSPQVIAKLEAKYGMDKPLIIQLKNYLVSFVQGDMGVSIKMQKNREVSGIIAEKFPVSVRVGVIALIWAVIVGIPLGCLAAYNRGKWIDSLLRIVTTAGVAVPGFVIATVLLVIFGVVLKVLPTTGLDSWQNYIMPCFSLGFYSCEQTIINSTLMKTKFDWYWFTVSGF